MNTLTHPIVTVAMTVAAHEIEAAEQAVKAAEAALVKARETLSRTHRIAKVAIDLAHAEARIVLATEEAEGLKAQLAAIHAEADTAAPVELPVNRIAEHMGDGKAESNGYYAIPSQPSLALTETRPVATVTRPVATVRQEAAITKMAKGETEGTMTAKQAKAFAAKLGITLTPMDFAKLDTMLGRFHIETDVDGSAKWRIESV